MPEIAETKTVQQFHKSGIKAGHVIYVWSACTDCGKERWVVLRRGFIRNKTCRSCGSKRGAQAINRLEGLKRNKNNWRGGRLRDSDGYIRIWISSENPFFLMAGRGEYIFEHRLIMAQHLNRCLLRTEIIHHKNGIRDDNRIENLELLSRTNHSLYNKLCAHCSLRKEIRLLSWQIKEQSEQIKFLTSRLMGIG